MLSDLGPKGADKGLDGSAWIHFCPMITSMIITNEVCVRMMKEYFEIEASKLTPQYGFRKGLHLFDDEDY